MQLLLTWGGEEGSSRTSPGTNPSQLAKLMLDPGKAPQLELVETVLGFRNGLIEWRLIV